MEHENLDLEEKFSLLFDGWEFPVLVGIPSDTRLDNARRNVAHREQAPEAIAFFRHLRSAPQPWRLALLRRLRCALSSSGE
jgi:hypothetical protein